MTSLALVAAPNPAEAALVQLEDLRQSLAQPLELGEAMQATRRASAIREWARVGRLGQDVALEAGELHVRAMRSVGLLLLDIVKNAGTSTRHHPGQPRTLPYASLPKGSLDAYGLSSKLSSSSQLVAKIPKDEFEARIGALRDAGRPPSLPPFLRAAQAYMAPKRRRATPVSTRLQHALADVREIGKLQTAIEVAAARKLVFVVDKLLDAYDDDVQQRTTTVPSARITSCLLCARERVGQAPRCACGGAWITA